jgi:hypothetical protein
MMKKDIRELIAEELHRPARRRYPTRRVVLKGIDDLVQADLVDMQTYSKTNRGFRYILTIINCFSKVAQAIPLKSKSGVEVAKALKSYFSPRNRRVKLFQTDLGGEFYNPKVKSLLQGLNIKHYSTYSDKKASIVERFNRTLKGMMWRSFTAKGTYRWLDLLPGLIKRYNNTPHRSIGMKPIEVGVGGNEELVRRRLNTTKRARPPKFSVGDKVRISKQKMVFDKAYLPSWTNEIFEIRKVQSTIPPTYLLVDGRGEVVKGSFYEPELMKSKTGDVYLVEKVLRRKKDMVLVRWLGYDRSHDSWIRKDEII